jgi:DNA-directed RNA polymerase subunit RPC12/RpoP
VNYDFYSEDYEVTCARCGRKLMASEATPEEGDEWECLPCNKRCNEQERAERTHMVGLGQPFDPPETVTDTDRSDEANDEI